MTYRPEGKPKPIPETWSVLLTDYMLSERAADRPWTSISTRRSHIARMARALDVPPADVTGTMLEGWFGRQDHWKTETRRGYRNTMRSFFGWAHRTGRLDSNPASALPRVARVKGKAKPAPDRVWKESLLAADAREVVMLELACHLGMRRAEVAVCSTSDLHEEYSGWKLTVHGKGGKDREVPVTDELAAMILRGAAGHTVGASKTGYLFPGADNGHLSPRWVGTLCARAMPGVWTMHKLRHRYGTRALRATGNLRVVQELLGHESVATTEIYTEVDDAQLRAGAEGAIFRDAA